LNAVVHRMIFTFVRRLKKFQIPTNSTNSEDKRNCRRHLPREPPKEHDGQKWSCEFRARLGARPIIRLIRWRCPLARGRIRE